MEAFEYRQTGSVAAERLGQSSRMLVQAPQRSPKRRRQNLMGSQMRGKRHERLPHKQRGELGAQGM